MNFHRICLAMLLWAFPLFVFGQVKAPIIVATNTTLRVVSANLSSGSSQRYESPGLHILKGLKPDVVAIQEFNYASTNGLGINTNAAFREMLDSTFGTNFVYFRETNSYSIPNGIISRYPIVSSGSWDDADTGVNDRGFAWAQIDLPGTNDLYVVSVHLKASSGSSNVDRRTAEAQQLQSLMQSNFPANAWMIVAGDFNLYSDTEGAITTLTSFLSDSPVPTDSTNSAAGNRNTNAGRTERYDRVLASFSFTNNLVPVVLPSHAFTNGLVFDSRVYTPLSDVAPVISTDSGATGMQHMAVVKDFRINYTMTNFVDVVAPELKLVSTNILRWTGQTNVTYRVRTSPDLASWTNAANVSSTSTNFGFTNSNNGQSRAFYQVVYP